MTDKDKSNTEKPVWFAIKTNQDFRAEEVLSPFFEEVFFPKQIRVMPNKKSRSTALIPHVLFIRATQDRALEVEEKSKARSLPVSFWIYRFPDEKRIRPIPEASIELLRLISSDESGTCEIISKTDMRPGEKVRITQGIYAGYEGFVKRIKKNKHVIVQIEGLCLVMLPYIPVAFLERI